MKTPVHVDKSALIAAIADVESKGPVKNHSLLWKLVARKMCNPKITPSVVMLRVKLWNLEIKTKAGRRFGADASGKVQKTFEPKYTTPIVRTRNEHCDRLLKVYPRKYHSLIEKARRGSKNALLKLKCIDCANFDNKEIRYCLVTDCALWTIRPYQKKEKDNVAGEVSAALPENGK